MNKKQWYRRSADTCGSCSSSPNNIIWYQLPADTRAISSLAGLQTLWYRQAADTGQYRGNVFRDLHLYRKCRFCVGGFKLVHPFSASCFGGLVCAISGLLPFELPLCSDFEFQLSDFLIAPASRSP